MSLMPVGAAHGLNETHRPNDLPGSQQQDQWLALQLHIYCREEEESTGTPPSRFEISGYGDAGKQGGGGEEEGKPAAARGGKVRGMQTGCAYRRWKRSGQW